MRLFKRMVASKVSILCGIVENVIFIRKPPPLPWKKKGVGDFLIAMGSWDSTNEEIFNASLKPYQDALDKAGYKPWNNENRDPK